MTPTSQQQAQETLIGYIRRTLQALPAGYLIDANRFGGAGRGNIGCDDDATGPDAPVRFNAAGDLKVPPSTNNDTVFAAFSHVWRRFGWYVYQDDRFGNPNQFGVTPDGYRFRLLATDFAGYPPGFNASTPCFPGTLAKNDLPFPAVITP